MNEIEDLKQFQHSYRISRQWKALDVNFTSYVTSIIPYPNYEVQINYNLDGKWQLWYLKIKFISGQVKILFRQLRQDMKDQDDKQSGKKSVQLKKQQFSQQQKIEIDNKKLKQQNDDILKPFREGKLKCKDFRHAKVYSNKEMIYYDSSDIDPTTKKGHLKIFNPYQDNNDGSAGDHRSDFKIQLPTVAALPNNDSNEEKVSQMIEGTQMLVLHKSGVVVTIEHKNLYSNSSDMVLSFHFSGNSERGQTVSSILVNEQQKQYYIQQLNGKDAIVLYNPCYVDQPLQFMIFRLVDVQNQKQLVKEEINFDTPNFNIQIINVFRHDIEEDVAPSEYQQIQGDQQQQDQNKNQKIEKLCVWANYNNNGIPVKCIINLAERKLESTVNLNCFTDMQDEDDREWMLTEIIYYDNIRNITVFTRTGAKGEFLDVYNSKTNKVTYSGFLEPDFGITLREFSLDNKYFVEYEQQTHGDDKEGMPMIVEFKLNSIVTIQASLTFFMEQAGIMNQYGPEVVQKAVQMLTQENEDQRKEKLKKLNQIQQQQEQESEIIMKFDQQKIEENSVNQMNEEDNEQDQNNE